MTAPPYSGCDHSGFSRDDYNNSVNPGVYCGGLEIKGNSNVTFNPGIYVISGGDFL